MLALRLSLFSHDWIFVTFISAFISFSSHTSLFYCGGRNGTTKHNIASSFRRRPLKRWGNCFPAQLPLRVLVFFSTYCLYPLVIYIRNELVLGMLKEMYFFSFFFFTSQYLNNIINRDNCANLNWNFKKIILISCYLK